MIIALSSWITGKI